MEKQEQLHPADEEIERLRRHVAHIRTEIKILERIIREQHPDDRDEE
jgi:hypothetical protein